MEENCLNGETICERNYAPILTGLEAFSLGNQSTRLDRAAFLDFCLIFFLKGKKYASKYKKNDFLWQNRQTWNPIFFFFFFNISHKRTPTRHKKSPRPVFRELYLFIWFHFTPRGKMGYSRPPKLLFRLLLIFFFFSFLAR